MNNDANSKDERSESAAAGCSTALRDGETDLLGIVNDLNRLGEKLHPAAHEHGERYIRLETCGRVTTICFGKMDGYAVQRLHILWCSEGERVDILQSCLRKAKHFWGQMDEFHGGP